MVLVWTIPSNISLCQKKPCHHPGNNSTWFSSWSFMFEHIGVYTHCSRPSRCLGRREYFTVHCLWINTMHNIWALCGLKKGNHKHAQRWCWQIMCSWSQIFFVFFCFFLQQMTWYLMPSWNKAVLDERSVDSFNASLKMCFFFWFCFFYTSETFWNISKYRLNPTPGDIFQHSDIQDSLHHVLYTIKVVQMNSEGC